MISKSESETNTSVVTHVMTRRRNRCSFALMFYMILTLQSTGEVLTVSRVCTNSIQTDTGQVEIETTSDVDPIYTVASQSEKQYCCSKNFNLITWYKDGVEFNVTLNGFEPQSYGRIGTDEEGQLLFMNRITSSDQGTYKCLVSNDETTANVEFDICTKLADDRPSFTTPGGTMNFNPDETSVSLECEAIVGSTGAVRWLLASSSGGSVVVYNTTDTYTIIDTKRMSCDDPDSTIPCYHPSFCEDKVNDYDILKTTLTIQNPVLLDGQLYICEAKNDQGTGYMNKTISLYINTVEDVQLAMAVGSSVTSVAILTIILTIVCYVFNLELMLLWRRYLAKVDCMEPGRHHAIVIGHDLDIDVIEALVEKLENWQYLVYHLQKGVDPSIDRVQAITDMIRNSVRCIIVLSNQYLLEGSYSLSAKHARTQQLAGQTKVMFVRTEELSAENLNNAEEELRQLHLTNRVLHFPGVLGKPRQLERFWKKLECWMPVLKKRCSNKGMHTGLIQGSEKDRNSVGLQDIILESSEII